jgi:phosphopantethiene--protein transferase domain
MRVRSGIDTVHIPRISKILTKQSTLFLDRTYTKAERDYADSHDSQYRVTEIYAGRFAAKEAVSKALGTGVMTQGIGFSDIEITCGEGGALSLTLHGEALKKAQEIKVISSSVSITHEKDYATALCVLLTDEEV